MPKYELSDAELFFKEQLEKNGYKFIEKDGEKPVIIAEPLSSGLVDLIGNTTQDKKCKEINDLKMHSVPFFSDLNGNIYANWFPYY